MMGPSHAACGAAAWVALTADYTITLAGAAVPVGFGLLPVGDAGVLTGALICAGAALLPDIDHSGGTVSRSLPPFSRWLARLVVGLAGGHRRGTHSLIGLGVFVLLAWLSQNVSIPVGDALRWGALGPAPDAGPSSAREAAASSLPGEVWPLAALLSVLLIAFAVKVLAFVPDRLSHANWAVGILLGTVVALHPPAHDLWFVYAVGLGCAVHMLGDMVTTQGIHLLWPLRIPLPLPGALYRNRSFLRFPVLGRAGSGLEIAVLTPITLYALTGLICAAVAWSGVSLGL